MNNGKKGFVISVTFNPFIIGARTVTFSKVKFTSPLQDSWNARKNDAEKQWFKNKEEDWYRLYLRQQEDVYEPLLNVWTTHYYLFELS